MFDYEIKSKYIKKMNERQKETTVKIKGFREYFKLSE
jgi:hypothetical protein